MDIVHKTKVKTKRIKDEKLALLVEPDYRSPYIPFGLAKIATYLRNNGWRVSYVKGRKKLGLSPKQIWITTLFTFKHKITIETILFYKKYYPDADIMIGGIFASLMPDLIHKHTGIRPYVGMIRDAEKCAPAYDLFPDVDYSLGFTSRGCKNRCHYCVVPKIEGDMMDIKGWERCLKEDSKEVILWDNNFFAKSRGSIERDVDILEEFGKPVDFNQGLDCRLYNKRYHALMKRLTVRPIRFAFDHMGEDGLCQKAISMWSGSDGKGEWYNKDSNVNVYVLFNCLDTPADFYYRVREVVRWGGIPYPMWYVPYNDINREHVGKNWTPIQRNNARLMVWRQGQVTVGSKDEFEAFWGSTPEQYIEKLSDPLLRERIESTRNRRQAERFKEVMDEND